MAKKEPEPFAITPEGYKAIMEHHKWLRDTPEGQARQAEISRQSSLFAQRLQEDTRQAIVRERKRGMRYR